MPCDSGPYYHDDTKEKQLRGKLDRAVKELDQVTALLCGTLRELTKSTTNRPGIFDYVPGLEKWWVRHQEIDRKREERERKRREKAEAKAQEKARAAKLREEALAKLSAEEKEVLGHG